MVMKQRAVVALASDHFREWQASTNRAKMLDAWARGESESPLMPNKAETSAEYQNLAEISGTPWSHLIISSVAQALAVVDHRIVGEKSATTKTFGQSWKPNALMSRQGAIYRGALGQNLSYATTLPGKRPHTDAPMPIVKGVAATKMAAFYNDEGEDDFAVFAMRGDYQPGDDPYVALRLYDEDATYYLQCGVGGERMTYISHDVHKVGVTPVHRFAPRLDLSGRAWGEVEPFLPMLRRLDQDTFDRLIVQRFNSWRVRYVAGMVKPNTDAEKRAAAMALRVEDLLVSSDPATKFGTLDPTDIKPYIEAHDADVRDLAAVSQTPPHHLLGQVANLSAEALAAAEKSLMRKVAEYRLSFGQSWDSVLRSCAFILEQAGAGAEYVAEATNYETEVVWEDTEAMSLAAAADALGKIAEGLGVPVEMLWEELPFWKKGDTERAKKILEDSGVDAAIMQFLEQGAGSGLSPNERAADETGQAA
jgi:hypothetical protein